MIDSGISHDELVFVNNVLKDYDYMKEETKNSDNKCVCYNQYLFLSNTISFVFANNITKKWQLFNWTIIIVKIYIDDYKNFAIITSPKAICVD